MSSNSNLGAGDQLKLIMLEAEVNTLKRHVQILTAELGLVQEGILKKFGLQLVNTESIYYKSAHGSSLEGDSIKESLTLALLQDTQKNLEGDLAGTDANVIGITDEIEVTFTPIKREDQIKEGASDGLFNLFETPSAADLVSNENKDLDVAVVGAGGLDPENSDGSGQLQETHQTRSGTVSKSTPKATKKITPLWDEDEDDEPQNPHKCRHCSASFTTTTARNNHELSRHKGKKPKPFKCQYCETRFMHSNHKKEHERIHTGERPFKCRFCPSAFARSEHRTGHERIHTGERPYKWRFQFCQLSFARSDRRTGHERTHTEENSCLPKTEKCHKCKFCNRGFSGSSQLTKHERIHATPAKEYRCQFCNAAFATSYRQKRHEIVHAGEKKDT